MQIRALVGIGAALCLAAHGAGSTVTRDVADVDGDGVPEVVLSNEFLRVEIMTGEAAPPVEPASTPPSPPPPSSGGGPGASHEFGFER